MTPVLTALALLNLSAHCCAGPQPRHAVLFIHDSGNEHDTLLDAELTLELYPHKDVLSYWVSDKADGGADKTLAAYHLAPQELPVVLLLDRADAEGKVVTKVPIHRPLGYEKNLAAINRALTHTFGMHLEPQPPKTGTEPPPRETAPNPSAGPSRDSERRREYALLAEKAMTVAQRHRRRGDAVQAEKYYLAALNVDPTCAEAAYELAHLYLELGRTAQAVSLYARAARLSPAYPSPVLLYDNFDQGGLQGWVIQRGLARVVSGRLELAPGGIPPAVVGIQGHAPWTNYRLSFKYRDSNMPALGGGTPGFSCAVRSTPTGAYWFRTFGFGAEVFKTVLSGTHYLRRQLLLANVPWNDNHWHRRAVEVVTLPNGVTRLRWSQDGRPVGQCTDRAFPFTEGAISFQTESTGAQIDDVLVLRLQ